MNDMLAVFRSRTQAMQCRARLNACGVRADIVPTPTALKAGCGYSVKIPARSFAAAKRVIESGNYGALYGYVELNGRYGGTM